MAYGHCKPSFLPQFTHDNRSSSSRGFEMGPDHTVSCPRYYVRVIWSWGSLRLVWDWRTRKRGTEPIQLASGHLQAPPQARHKHNFQQVTSHVLSLLSRSFAPVTDLSNRGNLANNTPHLRSVVKFVHTHIYKRKIKDKNLIVIWAVQKLWSVLARTPSWWKRMCWIYVAVRTVCHVSVAAGLTALTSSRVHFKWESQSIDMKQRMQHIFGYWCTRLYVILHYYKQ